MINNCHKALVWLVSTKLKPVNIPINKKVNLGPYRSKTQPNRIVKRPPSTMFTEKIAEVATRVNSNSPSIDLKKTPKVNRIPQIVVPRVRKTTTTTHP